MAAALGEDSPPRKKGGYHPPAPGAGCPLTGEGSGQGTSPAVNGGLKEIGGDGGGNLENAADDSFYRTLPLGGFPPPKAPEGHGPTPSTGLITSWNMGHKMNLF